MNRHNYIGKDLKDYHYIKALKPRICGTCKLPIERGETFTKVGPSHYFHPACEAAYRKKQSDRAMERRKAHAVQTPK